MGNTEVKNINRCPREIPASLITETVVRLSIEAAYHLPADVFEAIRNAAVTEESELGKSVLLKLAENGLLAEKGVYPICQDTGTAVVFIDLGEDVRITDGGLGGAVEEGIRLGYEEGFLRKSIVAEPLFDRDNTDDNTPPVMHIRLVSGDRCRIVVAPKGGGSENMSRIKMLKPADGKHGVIDFVVDTVKAAGGNPCPPVTVGIGIGGNFETAPVLAKEALLLPVDGSHPDPRYEELEKTILAEINKTGIGPLGFGGTTTALAVHIKTAPCHIASLPVAVNINCHAARHAEAEL